MAKRTAKETRPALEQVPPEAILVAKLDRLARETRRKRSDVVRRLLDLATVQTGGDLALGGEGARHD